MQDAAVLVLSRAISVGVVGIQVDYTNVLLEN